MSSFAPMLPEIVVGVAAVAVLFTDVLGGNVRRAGAWVGFAAAAVAAVLAATGARGQVGLFGAMLDVDAWSVFVRTATAAMSALFLLWLAGQGLGGAGRVREAASLVLFSTFGCMILASARDFVVVFLALEIATMPAYVLVGIDRKDDLGLEGAMKYFLLSMVTSLVFLYGVSMSVALTGSTAFAVPKMAELGMLGIIAAVLVLAGLLAKLSVVPFHYWAPDAYAGAPAASVAFVSSVPKIAGTLVLVRVVLALSDGLPALLVVVAVVSLASMALGNLAAYPQKDLRRMMAYSAVAHAGYLLAGLAAGTKAGAGSAVLYSVLYALPSMGVMLVAAESGTALDTIAGLAKRRSALAWALVVFLASLIGVPPLAGFVGKLYVFTAALDAGLVWLVVAGVIASAVSAGFYLKVVRAAFFAEGSLAGPEDHERTIVADIALWTCVAATVALGILAGPLLAAVGLALT